MKVSTPPKTPLQSALQRLSHGSYYAARTHEVMEKAEAALDGFVGTVMNISHDTVERDVSRLGAELSSKVRRGERYLTRGEANQSAYNGALTDAADWMNQAIAQETEESERQELSQLLQKLRGIAADSQVEAGISGVKNGLHRDAKPRLEEVEQDSVGRDVHHLGRPLWDIFERSLVSLDGTASLARQEKNSLDGLISDLERLDSTD